ncbi:hypothetical protein [Micromonospora sp. NPDC005197]|uniref:hypothetical protein n=1 Tax=unclassified Micromonospora TaxID=2617518 RepID=UPI0033AA7155
MDRWLGIGGFITGVVGLVLTVYYARKAEELNLMRKRLEWPDLQAAANDLGRRIKTEFPTHRDHRSRRRCRSHPGRIGRRHAGGVQEPQVSRVLLVARRQ